ncbi:MAG: DNA polymerase I [Eubacterium sp.]|nr:DNA polymerase I [Eubacterium sp.]
MKKLVLIDGHSILNRAFYGVPVFTNSKGVHTNAVYGFLNIMFKIIELQNPDYFAVAFDVHAPTFRHKMFDDYKGTRKPMLPELKEQVPLIKELLGKMDIKTLELEGYEADDILGTMAGRGEKEGLEVSVISGDRDLLQLATDKVQICIPKTSKGQTTVEYYNADAVKEKYHVTPAEFIDVKALMGDSSDNIPGVPGIGEKGATNIISEFGSIENAKDHAEEISNTRNKNAFIENYELAVLSKELATIDTDCPVDAKVSECEFGDIYTKEALDMVKELEMKSMISRFENVDSANDFEENFQVVSDAKEIDKLFSEAKKADKIGLFIYETDKLEGLGLCFGDEAYYIKTSAAKSDESLDDIYSRFTGEAEESSESDIKTKIKELVQTKKLVNNDVKKYNKYLEATKDDEVFDASLAAYLLNPLANSYEYDDIAKDYLGLLLPAEEEIFPKTKKDETPSREIEDNVKRFVCMNAYVLYNAKDKLEEALKDTEMYDVYKDIEVPLSFALYDMEQVGIHVDGDALKEYSKTLQSKISEMEKEIYEEAGHEFNINSPKQLGGILFGEMELPGGKKTKTGYSTSAQVLEKLEPDYPFVRKILDYRQLTKLNSTYAEGLQNYISEDGRIHGTFNQTVTATGRISSTDPNLQNIPVRMEMGREIRKVFVPKDGCVFVDADYSQIELRILASISDDKNLIDAYKNSKDIHASTAALVFGVKEDEVTPLQRRNAKAVNFGIVYGISSFGLSQDLSISKKEAQQYIEDYFKSYPGVKKYLDESVEFAKENGYALTLYNRRRPIPELKAGNFIQKQFGERAAMNSPIQGTAADIMKIAMNKVAAEIKEKDLKSKIVLQIHDELLIEAYEDEVEVVKELLKRNMEEAASLKVPLDVDVNTGTNWNDAH